MFVGQLSETEVRMVKGIDQFAHVFDSFTERAAVGGEAARRQITGHQAIVDGVRRHDPALQGQHQARGEDRIEKTKSITDQQEAGVATALDVTRAEVRLATNELARLQQETLLLSSALQLKRVLNIGLGDEIIIRDEPLGLEVVRIEFSPARFAGILNQRADYRQAAAEVEREDLALRASRRERLPSLNLSGEWGYASESWTDDMKEQWAVSLGLSMPVFEGFRIDSQTRIAASALRQRELELKDLAGQIEADYRLALQSLQSGARQVEVARRAVSLNEREFELARIRFEEGVADNSDVVTAQAALAGAEDALVEAEFQYLQARISLARIEGDVRTILR